MQLVGAWREEEEVGWVVVVGVVVLTEAICREGLGCWCAISVAHSMV